MPNKDKVSIIVGFDGSCPHSKKFVKKEKDFFTLYPARRPAGDKVVREIEGYNFRFGIEVENSSRDEKKIGLHIDCEDESDKRMKYRDCLFTKHEQDNEWQMVPAFIKSSVATCNIAVRPGKTAVYSNPRYNYQDYENFIRSVKKDSLVKLKKAGESDEGRNIWLLEMTDPEFAESRKDKIVIIARNHPYESAGSYCVQGIVEYLLSGDGLAGYFLSRFMLYILPMTNPDGVYNGLSRLASLNGADIHRAQCISNKSHRTVKEVLDNVRPHLFMDIHNWPDKFTDGLLCLNKKYAERIRFYMPDQIEYGKKWFVETWEVYQKEAQSSYIPLTIKSWKDYCNEQFGTIGLVYEFPWFGRNAGIMKQTGAMALKAFLLARLEDMS